MNFEWNWHCPIIFEQKVTDFPLVISRQFKLDFDFAELHADVVDEADHFEDESQKSLLNVLTDLPRV
jgi:hypothetical protein